MVANVEVPNTLSVLVAVILPATKLDPVALSKNKLERNDDKALRVIVYRLDEVALVLVIFVILLCPTAVRSPFNVVVPDTVSLAALVVARVV